MTSARGVSILRRGFSNLGIPSLVGAFALVLASCTTVKPVTSDSVGTQVGSVDPVDTASNPAALLKTSVFVDDLVGPTQLVAGPKNTLIVAQLNGEEEAGTGQILLLDRATKQRTVLLDGLLKPTGVAWINNTLWVMVKRGLVKAQWDGTGPASPVEVILRDLPFNGRSLGTITPLPDETFLYETSGNLNGDVKTGTVERGSGTLWRFDPRTNRSSIVATGSKHPYAHVLLPDQRLAITEIGDGPGAPPPDELNIISFDPTSPTDASKILPPPNLGWPRCPSTRPTIGDCALVVSPIAVFPVSSTPTGVALAGDDLFVPLFALGTLQRISLSGWSSGQPPVAPTTVVTGLEGPHTVLLDSDGSLLITETLRGRITRVVL